MNPTRFTSIRANLAQVLHNCEPYLVPEKNLLFELNLQLEPNASPTEFTYVTERMKAAGQLLTTAVPDEGIKLKLTDLGRAELIKTR